MNIYELELQHLFLYFYIYRLDEDWNEICSQPRLNQTNELIMSPINIQNIPPLLANAVIKKPHESIESESISASALETNTSSTIAASTIETQHSLIETADLSETTSSQEKSLPNDPFSTMANFLPDNTFFYNEKNCYIFPGK